MFEHYYSKYLTDVDQLLHKSIHMVIVVVCVETYIICTKLYSVTTVTAGLIVDLALDFSQQACTSLQQKRDNTRGSHHYSTVLRTSNWTAITELIILMSK